MNIRRIVEANLRTRISRQRFCNVVVYAGTPRICSFSYSGRHNCVCSAGRAEGVERPGHRSVRDLVRNKLYRIEFIQSESLGVRFPNTRVIHHDRRAGRDLDNPADPQVIATVENAPSSAQNDGTSCAAREPSADLSIAKTMLQQVSHLIASCAYQEAESGTSERSHAVRSAQASIAALLHPSARMMALTSGSAKSERYAAGYQEHKAHHF